MEYIINMRKVDVNVYETSYIYYCPYIFLYAKNNVISKIIRSNTNNYNINQCFYSITK